MADNLTAEMFEELKYALKPTKDNIKQIDKAQIILILERRLDQAIEEQDRILDNLGLYQNRARIIATRIGKLYSKIQRIKDESNTTTSHTIMDS